MQGSDPSSLGVGANEARTWHRRAFGGLVHNHHTCQPLAYLCRIFKGKLHHMSPKEIGYAAAYEAYRFWIHHKSIQKPLGGNSSKHKEALIGLAVAEGTVCCLPD